MRAPIVHDRNPYQSVLEVLSHERRPTRTNLAMQLDPCLSMEQFQSVVIELMAVVVESCLVQMVQRCLNELPH